MGSFSLKSPSLIGKIQHELERQNDRVDKDLMGKMVAVTAIVYNTARARRPKISKQQQKAMGRDPKGYRVSDPNASFGVPVKTGDLQISIQKSVRKEGEKVVGRIFIKGPGARYAGYMEFGTSKIRPRSFLRSALHVQNDFIKKKFQEPMKP